jgi:peptidoglycan glycosyltransferase
MALVAAGIANEGTVMRPYLVDRIQAPDGKSSVLSRSTPTQWLRACEPSVAAEVTRAMQQVVSGGSGGRAAISGVDVAGKTGTAEVGDDRPTNAWFIGFAPADDPVVAVAVLVEGGGQGGRTAAPTAKPVLEAALKAQGVKK